MLDVPVRIFIGGQELRGWTSMNLERQKKDLTGLLNVEVFFTYLPRTPTLRPAVAGKPIHVYVGGHLAFTGTLDRRSGKTNRGRKGGLGPSGKSSAIRGGEGTKGGALSTKIGPNSYTITLRARGKTKRLIDCSHDHKTGTMTGAKTKPVIETLIRSFRVALDWRAPVYDMDKIRFRDGCRVVDEVQRVCNEYGYFAYETRDGKLRVTDQAGPETGEPLILGDNIIEFSCEQSEDQANSEIKVKGHRSKKNLWGREAVKREQVVKNKWVEDYAPLTLQHYTDGNDEALRRRAAFEHDLQASDSQVINVTVFHVQARSGAPWDIGTLHYVEIPPEGIFGTFECTAVKYIVNAKDKLQTELTLNPPPKSGARGAGALSGLAGSAGDIGSQRMAAAGVQMEPGQYPRPWNGPDLADKSLAFFDDPPLQPEPPVPLQIAPPAPAAVPGGVAPGASGVRT